MVHGRRAISEIVAALILVSIVMAGAFILYVYSSGLLGSLQAAQPQTPYQNQIALEYYDWTTTAIPGRNCQNLNCVRLILRNVGSGRGTLAAFYVSNSTKFVAISLNSTSTCPTATALNPQQTCAVALFIPSSFKITSGMAYIVKVVTRDGAGFSYTCIAGRTSGTP